MMTRLTINVPRFLIACLDCKRQVDLPAHTGKLPLEVEVPCVCGTKAIERFALLLQYHSEREPVATLPLQVGPPGMRR